MSDQETANMRNMTLAELLRYVDRSNPVAKELCERLEQCVDSIALLKIDHIEYARDLQTKVLEIQSPLDRERLESFFVQFDRAFSGCRPRLRATD